MSYLQVQGVHKRFDQPVLTDVSLEVDQGEVVALLGPSGSGKTTLLRIIGGFETADAGSVVVAGEDITRLPPAQRRCGMVFQNYALFPHLSVGDNVAFGLAGRPREEVEARVTEMLEVVGLSGLARRGIDQISGGQQQRVAVARALAPAPRVLLLDEPLSNLDPDLRERTRRQLREIIAATGITTLIVTHEQDEAFHIADRTAVLGDGRLRQVGTAQDLYNRPADGFVAGFIGRSSELPARPTARGTWGLGGNSGLETDSVWCPIEPGEQATARVRPESLALSAAADASGLPGKLVEVRWRPREPLATVELEDGSEVEVLVDEAATEQFAVGEPVRVRWNPDGPPALLFGREEE